MLLAFCLGASSSRWINDINLWVVAAPTGNCFIDFLAGFLKSEPDIARERENGGAAARRPHPSRALSTEALGARALDPHALGAVDGSSLDSYLQHSVLEAGVDLARLCPQVASCSFGTNRSRCSLRWQ